MLIDLADGNYLNDMIIDPNLDTIWNGQSASDVVIPKICVEMNQFLRQKGYPKQSP